MKSKYNNMKTIKIKKEVRENLKRVTGQKIGNALRIIIDNAEKPTKKNSETVNIHVKDDVLDELSEYKIYSTESYSDTIARLLKEYSDSHADDEN